MRSNFVPHDIIFALLFMLQNVCVCSIGNAASSNIGYVRGLWIRNDASRIYCVQFSFVIYYADSFRFYFFVFCLMWHSIKILSIINGLFYAFENANGNINVEKLFIVEREKEKHEHKVFSLLLEKCEKPNRFVFFIWLRGKKT